MDDFLKAIHNQAKKNPKLIVFSDGNEARVIEAAKMIHEQGLAIPILIQSPSGVESPEKDSRFEKFAARFAELRGLANKEGIGLVEARKTVKKPGYFATMMVEQGEADGMIAGPKSPSKERIVPAFQIIKTRMDGHKASGFFFMILPPDVDSDAANGGVLLFADCAINIDPTTEELAQIAMDTADSARRFGLEPKVAFLSFSTAGSSQDPHVLKVRRAAEILKKLRPDLAVEGQELQADAALMDHIAAMKAPGSQIAGHANVLIFPDLNSGNIAYKLVERLAGAKAVGPVVQGLKKPVNEVSRGCSVDDIVNLTAITCVEAQGQAL